MQWQFIKILFDEKGRIIGARIEKYLLEKTRVVHQIDGERNFHILYYLLQGSSQELREKLYLTNVSSDAYTYLSCYDGSKSREDRIEFASTRECLHTVGIDNEVQEQIFSLLAGILLLGNVQFVEDMDGSVSDIAEKAREVYDRVCTLLGLNADTLFTVIAKRNIHVQNSTIIKSQNILQVDFLFRFVYACVVGS